MTVINYAKQRLIRNEYTAHNSKTLYSILRVDPASMPEEEDLMDNEELEIAYKKFKESFNNEGWAGVSPKMVFEYSYLAGQSSMLKEMDICNDTLEDILYADTISSEINGIVLDAKDKIIALKKEALRGRVANNT